MLRETCDESHNQHNKNLQNEDHSTKTKCIQIMPTEIPLCRGFYVVVFSFVFVRNQCAAQIAEYIIINHGKCKIAV